MKNIYRGGVYFVDFEINIGSEQSGNRPAVVVQNNKGNKYSSTIIIVPITTTIKRMHLPTHVYIKKNEFLKKDSIVLIEQIRVIDKSRIKSFIGMLSKHELRKIEEAIINTLNLK